MSGLLRYTICVLFFTILSACVEKSDSSKVEQTLENDSIVQNKTTSKINGVSFVASADSLLQKNVAPLVNIKADYAAIMPFAFIKNLEHPEVVYDQERQWFGETMLGVKQHVNLLQENNIKVMLKPQIWVWRGEFTGLLKMASEEDWLQLEATYRNFILEFAKLAEKEEIEIFCIGTELEKFIEHRPEYWRTLISEVREIYKGKLTYAANWDEYKRVPFWDILDYVGVDAYFPISENKTPTVEESVEGWKQWKNELKAFSEKENRKIIFTEYGYRSVDYSGKEPWQSSREMNSVNLEAQANLLDGLNQSVWAEDWFAGGFIWKWFIAHNEVGGTKDNQFTPQNKPAETILKINNSKNE